MAAVLHEETCSRSWPQAGWEHRVCDCRAGRYEERGDVMGGAAVVLAAFRTVGGDIRYAVERKADGRVGVFTVDEMRP